jgi:hypothetical protein
MQACSVVPYRRQNGMYCRERHEHPSSQNLLQFAMLLSRHGRIESSKEKTALV